MSRATKARAHESLLLDTDQISPDSLKSSLGYLIDNMLARSAAAVVGINWGTARLEIAPHPSDAGESIVRLSAEVLP